MQGVDKPLLPTTHKGKRKPMIDHVVAAVSDVNEILISANRSLADYAPRGQVVTDAELNVAAEGPLMGVLAGLRSARTPWLLTCPGDTPYLDTNWHHALIAQAVGANPRSLAFTVHDGERLQPLHTLVRIQAHDHLLAYLAAGKRSAIGWLSALDTVPVHYEPTTVFASVNHVADLQPAPR
jgi:molybdopterin-guanine dinucleotide biosynthesis protein A